MKFKKLFENWDMTHLKIKASFLEMDWEPKDADKDAAWELYVELLTRVTTQALNPDEGDEETALESVYSIFPSTRDVLKRHGKECIEFSKVAVIVLNQIVRPFASKWHKAKVEGRLSEDPVKKEFREDLRSLQEQLLIYTRVLSEIADVEDLTELESNEA